MAKIDLKNISKEAEQATEYFTSKTNARVKTKGALIEVEGMTDKAAKFVLHKFLHHIGLDGYRVIVVQPGLIEVHPPEPVAPHVSSHGTSSPPPANVTMPYYFPGASAPVPASKKRKK
jgi:hypothetical protein